MHTALADAPTPSPLPPANPPGLTNPPARPWRRRWGALVQREWMQHRTGWLALMLLPLAGMLLLALLDLATVQFSLDGLKPINHLRELPPELQTLMWSLVLPATTGMLALLASALQLPGLARRDVQDRSIGFWRALPVADHEALAATLVTHLLLLPGLALLVALAGAQLVAMVSIGMSHGPWAWLTQPWWQLVPSLAAVALRVLLGLVLLVLWWSPLLLLAMAATAWLKRWGVPVVVIGLLLGTQLLDPQLPQAVVGPTLQRLALEARHALMDQPPLQHAQVPEVGDAAPMLLDELPGWAARDAGRALARLASPALVPVLGGAALGFWLLLWRRRKAS